MNTTTLSGLYLGVNAGGWSRRWGGVDKALSQHQGRRLVDWVLDGLNAYPLLGVCIRQAQYDAWQSLGYPLWIETADTAGMQGPLCGIYTLLSALEAIKGEWLLLLPCDMPNIDAEVIQALISTQQQTAAPCVSLRDVQGRDAMVALIHHACKPALYDFLQRGERRYRDWLACMNAVACVDVGQRQTTQDVFANLNIPPSSPPALQMGA